MRRRVLALLGGAVVATLAWPSPVHAQTNLGGYSGVARAVPLRIEVIDPTIPLPSDPQGDFGIGYTKVTTDTGPSSRATSSYLWPGDVLGDGFDQITQQPGSKYPVQVNSRYPATKDAPTKNKAQVTNGNGMFTSSDENSSQASATGLGITDGGTNLVGGPGAGLCTNANPNPSQCPPDAPAQSVPVPAQLAAAMTVGNVVSQSTVALSANKITSTATAAASEIDLLGGIISIKDVRVTTETVSDGAKATVSGHVSIAGVSLAGHDLGIGENGVNLAGKSTPMPPLPDALKPAGISFSYQPTTKQVQGAGGSFDATGLVVSVDTALVKNALKPLTGALSDLLGKIPNMGQVQALLGLGPKFVFLIGDVSTAATASPTYSYGGGGTTSGGTTGGGTAAGGTGSAGAGGGSFGGTGTGAGGSATGGDTMPLGGGANAPAGTGGGTTPTTTGVAPVAYSLPGLGTVPRLLILGALALAVGIGWVFRTAGGFLLGSARNCVFGLTTGLPDLRKG